MKIKSVEIDDIRSHDHTDIEIPEGLSLFYGKNGSGKSTVLQSLFAGLFQSKILKQTSSDFTLDAIVRNGEEEGRIKLEFIIDGETYEIEWVVSVSENEDGERKAKTDSCVLTGGKYDESIEGVNDVQDAVRELIGLGPKAFSNSVYIQQGEIQKFVNADSDEREEIIDELLGLQKIDVYIERMEKARKELKLRRREIDGRISELENQIESKPEKDTLEKEITDLKQEKKQKESKISNLNNKIDEIKDRINNKDDKISTYQEKENELRDVDSKCEKIKGKIDEYKSEKKNFEASIDGIESEKESLKDQIERKKSEIQIEIPASVKPLTEDIEQMRSEKSDIAEKKTEIDSSISNIEDKITDKTSEQSDLNAEKRQNEDNIDTLQEKLKSIEKDITDKKEEKEDLQKKRTAVRSEIDDLCEKLGIPIESSLKELSETHIPETRDNHLKRVANTHEQLGRVSKEHELLKSVSQNNECVICGNSEITQSDIDEERIEQVSEKVSDQQEACEAALKDESAVLDNLSANVSECKTIDAQIDSLGTEITQLSKRKNDKSEDINRLENEVDELISEKNQVANEIEELVSEKASKEEELSKYESRLESKTEEIEEVKTIKNDLERIQKIEDKVESYKSDISHREELINNKTDSLIDAQQKKSALENEVEDTDIDELKMEKEKYEKMLEECERKLEKRREDVEEKSNEITRKQQTLDQIVSLKSEKEDLKDEKSGINEFISESNDIIDTYGGIKTMLRSENLVLMNKYANEIFKNFYNNQTYKSLKIDDDYTIRLITSSGDEIEPKLSSGGEGTIISLSIRAAVYKILTERTANEQSLPPFIMDEPTTFLDDTHVKSLRDVINTISEWNVPQVILVSHTDELIQTADNIYNVSKDPATETSIVTKEN